MELPWAQSQLSQGYILILLRGLEYSSVGRIFGSIHEALASTSITKENRVKVPARDPNTQEMEAGDQKFKAIPGYMASFEIKKEKKHNLEALQAK